MKVVCEIAPFLFIFIEVQNMTVQNIVGFMKKICYDNNYRCLYILWIM